MQRWTLENWRQRNEINRIDLHYHARMCGHVRSISIIRGAMDLAILYAVTLLKGQRQYAPAISSAEKAFVKQVGAETDYNTDRAAIEHIGKESPVVSAIAPVAGVLYKKEIRFKGLDIKYVPGGGSLGWGFKW